MNIWNAWNRLAFLPTNNCYLHDMFQAHEKEVTRLQQEIDIAREQKEIALKRVRNSHVTQLAINCAFVSK